MAYGLSLVDLVAMIAGSHGAGTVDRQAEASSGLLLDAFPDGLL
jgi:hypothetical protein